MANNVLSTASGLVVLPSALLIPGIPAPRARLIISDPAALPLTVSPEAPTVRMGRRLGTRGRTTGPRTTLLHRQFLRYLCFQ